MKKVQPGNHNVFVSMHPYAGNMDDETLMEAARKASENSYSPYSHFQVGAAVLTRDGDVITGCNVENSSYSLSVCAERAAIFKAVSRGRKKGDFVKIAVAGRPHNGNWQFCSPCGACRQVLYEFTEGQFQVIYLDKSGALQSVPIEELIPDGFTF
jgi:cytidine deaminase